MTTGQRIAGAVACGYFLVVTAIAVAFLLLGHLLGRAPLLPARVERAYADWFMRSLDAVLGPIDAVPTRDAADR